MLLTQGPWLPLVLSDTLPPVEPSILHDNAVAATAEIDNSDAITDQYYNIMADAVGSGGELEADGDIATASMGLADESSSPWDGGLDQAAYNGAQTDADAVQAEREIPPEAYQPAPGDPPLYDSRQTFTIENPTGGGGIEPIEPIEPVITYDATVALSNLSRPGAAGFNVGERFRLDIKGQPGQAVRVESTRNSDLYPSTFYGYTDAGGKWSLEGVQDLTSKGVWIEKWFVGETVAFPILNFQVT
jgi:hypothetical protein